VTATAIIQSKPGIGDTIWHLPFVRAIAAASPGGRVTFLAPPTSLAAEILQAEDCVARTLYFDHFGSELARLGHLLRLAALLRRHRFDTLWILDRTNRPAVAGWLAGIPNRIGLGFGLQRLLITNPGIDRGLHDAQPFPWFKALLAEMNVPLPTTEPNLTLPPAVVAGIGTRFAAMTRPWIVIGLGASHPDKDWPRPAMAEFVAGVRRRTTGTVFLIGGQRLNEHAGQLLATTAGAVAVNACDLSIVEAGALLQLADLFVGPNSGPMNLAAAVGTPAFGLFFGNTPRLDYSKNIRMVFPDDGSAPTDGGRGQISPAKVLAQIEPYLASGRVAAAT
jgi:heptosyltransferase-2